MSDRVHMHAHPVDQIEGQVGGIGRVIEDFLVADALRRVPREDFQDHSALQIVVGLWQEGLDDGTDLDSDIAQACR